jgi:hypothetical protein
MSEQGPESDAGSLKKLSPESQQQADDELVFPDLKLGDGWGESITRGRADELEAMLQNWHAEQGHGERKRPFRGHCITQKVG